MDVTLAIHREKINRNDVFNQKKERFFRAPPVICPIQGYVKQEGPPQ